MDLKLRWNCNKNKFTGSFLLDRLTDQRRQGSPWNMMFADDIMICNESRLQVKEGLENV